MEYMEKIGNWDPPGNKAPSLCVSLCLYHAVSWLCIISLFLQTILRVCKWPIISALRVPPLVPEAWRRRLLLINVCIVFLLGLLALQAANRQANERKWGSVVVIKNIPGYPGCSLVTGGRTTRNMASCLSSVPCSASAVRSSAADSLSASQATACWSRVLSGPAMFSSSEIAAHLEVRF